MWTQDVYEEATDPIEQHYALQYLNTRTGEVLWAIDQSPLIREIQLVGESSNLAFATGGSLGSGYIISLKTGEISEYPTSAQPLNHTWGDFQQFYPPDDTAFLALENDSLLFYDLDQMPDPIFEIRAEPPLWRSANSDLVVVLENVFDRHTSSPVLWDPLPGYTYVANVYGLFTFSDEDPYLMKIDPVSGEQLWRMSEPLTDEQVSDLRYSDPTRLPYSDSLMPLPTGAETIRFLDIETGRFTHQAYFEPESSDCPTTTHGVLIIPDGDEELPYVIGYGQSR